MPLRLSRLFALPFRARASAVAGGGTGAAAGAAAVAAAAVAVAVAGPTLPRPALAAEPAPAPETERLGAAAAPPSRASSWSVAALGAWGGASASSLAGDGSPTRKYGLGIAAGYTLPTRVHVGLLAATTRGGAFGGDLDRRIEGGVEVGWEVPLGVVTALPGLGAGVIVTDLARPAGWPGATIVGALRGLPLYVGLDGRLFVAGRGGRLSATPVSFVAFGARFR